MLFRSACKLGTPHHTRPATQPMPGPSAAAIQAPAARTAEIQRCQTRRQCARQRLHARISDSVVCRPRAPHPPILTPRTLRAHSLAPSRSAATRLQARHTAPHATRNPAHARTNSRRNTSPQPHVPPRLSRDRLGGSARASASAPASPIWFPAGREHHSPPIRIPAPYVRTRPLRADPPPPGRKLGTPHHMRPATQRMPGPTAAAIQAPERTYR